MNEFRSVDGELKLLERQGDFIFPVELWMLNDSVNRNNWKFINLEEHRTLWAGVPILVAYVNGGRTVGSGHNQKTKVDANGEEYQSFTEATAERIVGAISENPNDIRLESRDGYTWVVGRGFLWAWYARELVDKIAEDARQGRTMSVSIEALVTQSRMEDGYEVEERYKPLGVTVLGDRVQPAVVDAHIAMLNAMQDEFKELKLRAASYIDDPESAKAKSKPQKSMRKGVETRMRLSKQQLRELQAKFGEYTVLAAEQTDAGVVVCLMGKSGETAIYKMASADESVVLDRVQIVNAQAHFCAEGCEDVLVDACDLIETMSAKCADLSAKLETAQKNLNAANATVEQMVNAENARRLSAAKKMAKDTLAAFNANRENKVSDDAIKALCADIESGKFTACEDENHAWTGDKAVEEKVLSLCATAVMEMDKASAKASRSTYVWERLASGVEDDGSVEALLARKGIKG